VLLVGVRSARTHACVQAPIGEEICFRACVIYLLTPSTLTNAQAIYLTPMLFGGAHVHHFVQRIRHGDTFAQASLETGARARTFRCVHYTASVFQMAYTYAFGVYAAYVYVYTRSLWPAVGAHMFCNAIGFPDVQALVDAKHNTRTFYILVYVFGVTLWLIQLINFTHKYTSVDDLR
jgi:prenyl protein peptidase